MLDNEAKKLVEFIRLGLDYDELVQYTKQLALALKTEVGTVDKKFTGQTSELQKLLDSLSKDLESKGNDIKSTSDKVSSILETISGLQEDLADAIKEVEVLASREPEPQIIREEVNAEEILVPVSQKLSELAIQLEKNTDDIQSLELNIPDIQKQFNELEAEFRLEVVEEIKKLSQTKGDETGVRIIGVKSLSLLDDVQLTNLQDDDVLQYNVAIGKWENKTPAAVESQTLQAVTDKGASTNRVITVGGMISNGTINMGGEDIAGVGVIDTDEVQSRGLIQTDTTIRAGHNDATTNNLAGSFNGKVSSITVPYSNPEVRLEAGEDISSVLIESNSSELVFLGAENDTDGFNGSALHVRSDNVAGSDNYLPVAANRFVLKDTGNDTSNWGVAGALYRENDQIRYVDTDGTTMTLALSGRVLEVGTAAELEAAINGTDGDAVAGQGDTVRLTASITATNPLDLKAGINLDLMGFTLSGQIVTDHRGDQTPTFLTGGIVDSSGLSRTAPAGHIAYGLNHFADGQFVITGVEFVGDKTDVDANLITFVADLYACQAIMTSCQVHGAGNDCISTKKPNSRALNIGLQSFLKVDDCEAYDPGTGGTDNCITPHDGFRIHARNCYFHSPANTGTNPNLVTADAGGSDTPLIIENCVCVGGLVTASEIIDCYIEPRNVAGSTAVAVFGQNFKVIGNTIVHPSGTGLNGIDIASSAAALSSGKGVIKDNYVKGYNSTSAGNGGINVQDNDYSGELWILNNTVTDCYRGIDARSGTGTIYVGGNKVYDSGQFDFLTDSSGATVVNYGGNIWGSATANQVFGPGRSSLDNVFTQDLLVDSAGDVQVANNIDVGADLTAQTATLSGSDSSDGFKLSVNGDTPSSSYEKGVTFSGRSFMSRQMSINGTSNFYTLLHTDGSALNSLYQYKVSLNVAGTGTDSGACYLVWYEGDAATWRVTTVSKLNEASNHPLVSLESGVPTVRLVSHASNYTVTMHMEAMYTGDTDAFPNGFGADYGWVNDTQQLTTTRDVIIENASVDRSITLTNDGIINTVRDGSGSQNNKYAYVSSAPFHYPSDAFYRARGTEASPADTIDGDYGSGSNTFVRYNGNWVGIYGFLTRRSGVGAGGPRGRVEYFVNDGTVGGHNNQAMVLEPERLTVNGDIRTSDNTLDTDVANNRVSIADDAANANYNLDVNGTFGFTPGTSVTPVNNGDVVIEATNNTTLTFKLKGTDGTVRSGTLTLS